MRVVLIHGMTNSARAFDRLTPLLHGLDVTALDLPGHGAKASTPCPVSIDEMAAAILPEIDGPAVLVGHSLGGHVATALAQRSPDLVTHLVLVNSPPTLASRRGARRLSERVMRSRLTGPLLWPALPKSLVRMGLRSAFAPDNPVPDVFVDDLRLLTWLTYSRATTAADDYLTAATLYTRVGAMSTPVTVVFGAQDGRVDPPSMAQYDRATTEVVAIADAGHTPAWETPDQVAAVLRTVTATA